jgi:hypothetical protein
MDRRENSRDLECEWWDEREEEIWGRKDFLDVILPYISLSLSLNLAWTHLSSLPHNKVDLIHSSHDTEPRHVTDQRMRGGIRMSRQGKSFQASPFRL